MIDRVVAMLSAAVWTAASDLAPADAEVERVLGDMPSVGAAEPARLGFSIRERVEHSLRRSAVATLDRERVVLRGSWAP